MTHVDFLNSAQRKAVEHTDGPLLVLAGAGAGKTRVITTRILHLVKGGVAPEHILAITFTNKAASEMRDRIIALLENDAETSRTLSGEFSRPHISTFHSLGVTIIRDNAHLLNLTRHFTIYDRNDSKRAVKEALHTIGVDPKQFEPKKILGVISQAKGDGYTQSDFEAIGEGNFIKEIAARAWKEYKKILAKDKALDFDDLLLEMLLLLKNNASVREHYQHLWSHIHVDEYQDTNGVQYEISKILAEKHNNICVVGDMDQTIYTWRGANLQNLMNFERDFPGVTTILLEENYRSTATIIAASNTIIKKNSVRKEKNLYTKNEEGEKIALFSAHTEEDEAAFVARTAAERISSGVSADNIAVLYRANFQSRILEEAFLSAGVPYQILGTRFFERKEVKDVLSFLRFALNETDADLARIINVPTRGIGKTTLLKLLSGKREELTPALARRVDGFYKLIDNIRQIIFTKRVSDAVKYAITETGLEAHLLKGSEEDRERLENLRELVTLSKKYDHLADGDGVTKLIEEATLASDQDALAKNEHAVKLMTVHASKGLEFDTVFITGLEEGLFPHEKLNEDALSQEEREEERRLFYVALTRAKQRVFLSFSSSRTIFGSRQMNAPSEFIDDIEDEFLEAHDEDSGEFGDGLLGDWSGKTIYVD